MNVQDAWSTAMAWLAKARERSAAGERGRAEEALKQALSLLGQVGEELTEGNAWLWLGQMRLERGDLSGALEAFQEASARFEAGGHQAAGARAELAIGEALLRCGAYREAAVRLEQAVQGLGRFHAGLGEALAWSMLGEARAGAGAQAGAREAFTRCHEIVRELNAPGWEARARAGLGRMALSRGAIREALYHASGAVEACASIEDRAGMGWGLLLQAEVVMASGRPGAAWWTTRRALRLFRQIGCEEGEAEVRAYRERWPWWRVVWAEISGRLGGGPRQLPPPRTHST